MKSYTASRGKARYYVGVGIAALGLAAVSAPAQAQDAGEDEEEVAQEVTTTQPAESAIVVTGSRIRRDTFSSIEPITVVTAEEITQSGFNSTTDALQSQQVTGGAGQINNFFAGFVTAGGTGANTLGLRGLGPARTLVLLNGRRIAPAGTRGNVLAADLNVLPTAIVDRVEILKAGASSIYGSDAVAGVVNIMTDTKTRGLTLDAQVNVPQIGAGVDRRISATFGFGDDRLDVIGSFEYRKRDAIRLNDVDFTSCPIGGYLSREGAEFGSGDGVRFQGDSCFTLDNGGVTINTLGLPNRNAIARTGGAPGTFNRFVPAPGQGNATTPGYLGVGYYDRDSFAPSSQEEEVITPVEIYTGFIAASYDLNSLGNAEVYGEVLATRRKSSSILHRQLTIDWLRGSPLLPEIFRNGTFANPNNVSSGIPVAARGFVDFGNTSSAQAVDYVRAGGGLRGDFFIPGWRYDAYVGKSWTDGTYEVESFLIDRIAASMNVVEVSPGVFRCAASASLANCVPGPALSAEVIGGVLPQAWRDYILVNTVGETVFRETTFAFGVDGGLFSLPGGEVKVALGVEYRKQRINDTPDENSIRGNLLGLTAGTPTRGTDNVKEVFGEIFIPLVANRPFLENVNLNASVRYTDYASYGSDVTYKMAGEWEFFKGFGIRGSYGTSYRAPALAEQFLGATSGFIASANDPCDRGNFPTSAAAFTPAQQNRAANCASIGIDVLTFQQNNGITVFTRGGAETGLSAETSKNWSVGAVIQPNMSSAFRVSAALDYFDITVENGVSSLTGATILSRCYNDLEFNPSENFCRFVTRSSNNELSVVSGFVNLSTNIVKGFELATRISTDALGGELTLNADITRYTEQSNRLFPEEFLRDVNGTLNNPDWVGSFTATYRKGKTLFRYGVEWSDSSSGTYDLLAFSRTTGQVNQATAQALRDGYLLEVPDYFLHSASVQFSISPKFTTTLGVRNIFNTEPPRVSADFFNLVGNAPLYSGYDYTGRQFFINTKIGF